jgi:Meiotically up-regulated gene 113
MYASDATPAYGWLMGQVYAFRNGGQNEFKFGRTTNLERRRRTLQTGSPRPLILFDHIETGEAKDGEDFILRRLATQRLIGEFFAVTADEASAAMDACRIFLERELPILRAERERVAELAAVESGSEMLPSSEDLLDKYRALLLLRARKKLLRIDIDRIEADEQRLETAIKLAIGTAKGIEGIATWETGESRRMFNAEFLKAANPELYELYSTKFDQARFRMEHPDDYWSYQETRRVRKFNLIEDP